MPDFGVELHDGRAEGVLDGDDDVDHVRAALVRRAGGAGDAGLEVCQVAIRHRLSRYFGAGRVAGHVAQLLGHATGP